MPTAGLRARTPVADSNSYSSNNNTEVVGQGWIAFLTCYSYENNVDADGNKRVEHQPGRPAAA